MHVLSGSRFDLETSYVPTVEDIAQGLIGIPRWAGATIIPWSVLHHSLSVSDLVAGYSRRMGTDLVERPREVLLALWHDAAEFATGDIPSPHKTTEQRWHEENIQELLIRKTLGITPPDDATARLVKEADMAIRSAEARTLAHPQVWEDFEEEGDEWTYDAVNAVWRLLRVPDYVLVDRFIDRTNKLLVQVGQRR